MVVSFEVPALKLLNCLWVFNKFQFLLSLAAALQKTILT